MKNNPQFLVVDLFCGAGGTTTGFAQAEVDGDSIAKVIACVNHDHVAIQSHWANHPEVKHFEEDIRTLPMGPLKEYVSQQKHLHPGAKLILWASLECTNFSKAKGGQPRDADSRTLANHLFRYIDSLKPDAVMIENVEEFMSWGPLDEKGNPISRYEGRDYMAWVIKVKRRGYTHDYRMLNSADYGSLTSRERYFGLFAGPGFPIVFPVATHAKKAKSGSLFESELKPWRACREALDLQDVGDDIFEELVPKPRKKARLYLAPRKPGKKSKKKKAKKSLLRNVIVIPPTGHPWLVLTQGHFSTFDEAVSAYARFCGVEEIQLHFFRFDPLSDRTKERIYAGLIKFVAGGKKAFNAFLMKMNSGSPSAMCTSIDDPAGTLTTKGHQAKVQFVSTYNGGNDEYRGKSLEEPLNTVVTRNAHSLVSAQWIDKQYGSGPHNHSSIEAPAGSLLTNPKNNLVSTFIVQRNGGDPERKPVSIEGPARTLTTSGGNQDLVQAFMLQTYATSSVGDGAHSIDTACRTITTRTSENLVHPHFLAKYHGNGDNMHPVDGIAPTITTHDGIASVRCFLMNHNFDNGAKSVDAPAPTILASRRHYYLVNPGYRSAGSSIDQPAFTLVASMNKVPPYLIATEAGMAVAISPIDSLWSIKLKEFMALYGIAKITMRMLKVMELKRIQGFPQDYVLLGTQSDQKKFIGNSVEPRIPKHWAEALAREIKMEAAA